MLSKLTHRTLRISSICFPHFSNTQHYPFTTLATNYVEKGYALLLKNQHSSISMQVPEKEKIPIMCAALNISTLKQDPNNRDLFVERISEQLSKFPIQQQFLQFQTVITTVKFKSLEMQNCQELQFMVDRICGGIIKKSPSLQKYYANFVIPNSANLRQTVILLLNMQFILAAQKPQKKHEIEQKLLGLIFCKISQMNYSVIVSFFADCVNKQYDIPYDFLVHIYQKMNLQIMKATYRYYFLKFSQKQYEKQKIYPYHNFFPMYSNIVKFTNSVQAEQVPLFVDNIVLQFTLCQKTALKIMPHLFLKKLVGFQRFLNDRKFNSMQLIKIYNQISSVIPLGLRMVKDILTNKNLKVETETDLRICKQFLTTHLRNISPIYIYSLEETTTAQVNQPLLALLKTLLIRVLPSDPKFVLETTSLFSFNQQFGNKFLRQFGKSLQIVSKNVILSLKGDRSQLIKLINLLYTVRKLISIPNKICPQVLSLFYNLDSLENDVQLWRCMYQLLVINKQNNLDADGRDIINLYHKFCKPYIQEDWAQNTTFFREPDFHEEYLLRIAGLLPPDYLKNKKGQQQNMVKFINNKFIYTVKSVVKEGSVQILLFLNNIPDVRPEIHAYLYSSLSTFIMYINSKRKFYLQRGCRYQNDMLFINTLKNAATNYDLLSSIGKKDRLHILCTLAIKYWNNLTRGQILKIMMIIGDFSLLNEKFKERFRNTTFTEEDIEDISEKNRKKLEVYKMINPSIAKLCASTSTDVSILKLNKKKINELSQQEVIKLFEHPEYYEKALEMKQFTRETIIPEPVTSDPKIKMIYVCLKLVGKIRKYRDYSIRAQNTGDRKIDIHEEIQYINEHGLIKQNNLNEFKLNNVEVQGHYEMLEGWSSYEMLEELIELEEYNPFTDVDENPFKRVLIAVYGSMEMVKQLVKKEIFYSEVLYAALQLGLDAFPKGSMIEISNEKDRTIKQLYVLCSNSTNYKLHMIYAFILEQVGYEVRQVEDIHGVQEISGFLSKRMGASLVKLGEKEDESDQSEDMDKKNI